MLVLRKTRSLIHVVPAPPSPTGAAGRLATFTNFGDRVQGASYLVRPDERLQIIPHERIDSRTTLKRADAGSAKHVGIHAQGQICHGFSVARIPCRTA